MMLRFLSQKDKVKVPSGSSRAGQSPSATVSIYPDDAEVRGLCDLYSPEPTSCTHIRDVVDVLLEMSKITDEQYGRLRRETLSRPGTDPAASLLKEGLVGVNDVLEAKAKLNGMEFRHLSPQDVDKTTFQKLDIDFIKKSNILPVGTDGDKLIVATSEPANVFAMEDVRRQTGMELHVVVCTPEDITAICEALHEEPAECVLDDIISDMTEVEVVQDQEDICEDLEQMAGQSPVIKFVNYLISNAVREGASDIHIEPKEKETKIRYRIDGVLFEASRPPQKHARRRSSRASRSCPTWTSPSGVCRRTAGIRASSGAGPSTCASPRCPPPTARRPSFEFSTASSIRLGLEHLGMEPDVCKAFQQQVTPPHGIRPGDRTDRLGQEHDALLGAGRAWTADKLNISTVEDPVEYELDFVQPGPGQRQRSD